MDDKGLRPLLFSLFWRQPAVADILIEAGADVNAKGPRGAAPLHPAADLGYTNTVRLLLQHGARVREGFEGKSALYLAKAKGHQEIVKLLESSEE